MPTIAPLLPTQRCHDIECAASMATRGTPVGRTLSMYAWGCCARSSWHGTLTTSTLTPPRPLGQHVAPLRQAARGRELLAIEKRELLAGEDDRRRAGSAPDRAAPCLGGLVRVRGADHEKIGNRAQR